MMMKSLVTLVWKSTVKCYIICSMWHSNEIKWEANIHTCKTLVKPQVSTNAKLVNVFKSCSHCEEYSKLLSKLSVLAFHTLFNEDRGSSLVVLHSLTELRELYKLTENYVNLFLSVGILS